MSRDTDTIWSALPLPAFILGADNRISEINPAAELFMNKSLRSLAGAKLWDKLTINANLPDAVGRVRADGLEIVINDVDVLAAGRAAVQCNIQVAPLIEDEHSILLLISPREIADRLGRAQSSKSSAKSAIGMAEMLAHEIKNPLAGITGAAQLLSMNLSDDDLELTDLIVAESRRIVKLLEQVEQFGNLRPPERRALNIHDLLDRARRSATVGFASNLRIEEAYDPSLPPTLADGDQLLQVFLNLLKNAAQAMESSGVGDTIRLRTFYDRTLRRVGDNGTGEPVPLQVEIIDNGPGIPADIASEVFNPFVSGRENGTGLGLALVSKIISDHGGLIAVDSSPGNTVFRLSLPVAPNDKGD
ncbi:ATPase [Actibacterium mucosum KCTC 23349]|uniref:histidine kinase n=1 Tax=Actibacterium mucosum KCTC 23349 TaxID=1454373 RepID=A0A037ZJZ0_9RHOB|nr:ATP-binding protein [Actibacterium mucosum]KAJ56765.1 ATPase [Actibacterium mucosum KCTC 23349]